tara:strand:- start:164 stop:442 length:279 start_codon:yes stop_codon:yes gene_type:complete
MCVGGLVGLAAGSDLAENFGDPFGSRKRRIKDEQESQKNRWAREDQIREASQAHELALADKGVGKGNWKGGNSNRSGLQAGQSQSSTTNRAY